MILEVRAPGELAGPSALDLGLWVGGGESPHSPAPAVAPVTLSVWARFLSHCSHYQRSEMDALQAP